MQMSPQSTARTWDSFKPTLIQVLAEFNPKNVLEYGPGASTLIMQDWPSIEHIDTVEHDVAWFHKWASQFGSKVTLILEEDLKKYPFPNGRFNRRTNDYDLYFIDGREREMCLDLCNHAGGVVILHDAERKSYRPHIQRFKHVFMEDEGHTCVMTNDDAYEKRLERIFCV